MLLFDREPFAPRDLFRGGISGAFLDLSQPYRYQDVAGTTAATADAAPLGLVYDLKNGVPQLGAERLTNGDFSSGSTGWTLGANWTVSGGKAIKTAGGTDNNLAYYGAILANRWYVVEFDIDAQSGPLYLSSFSPSLTVSPSGARHVRMLGFSSSTQFALYGPATSTITVDNFSIKELPGSHAYQTTTTARPLLYTTPYYYAKFDLGDDVWNTYLPAITNGTICLLTNKGAWFDTLTLSAGVFSIGPTTYTGGPAGLLTALRNAASDFRLIGMVVIDKALSASEKASLVAWGMSKGCPGEITLGGDLLASFGAWQLAVGSGISGNNKVVSAVSAPDGSRVESNTLSLNGKTFLVSATATSMTSGALRILDTATTLMTLSTNTTTVAARLFTSNSLRVDAVGITSGNMSLTLNEVIFP